MCLNSHQATIIQPPSLPPNRKQKQKKEKRRKEKVFIRITLPYSYCSTVSYFCYLVFLVW